MADQRTFLSAKFEGDHTYEKASKTQYIGNPSDKTKPEINTIVFAKYQDIKNFKSSMPNQPVINKVQDNTKSNTSVPKTFVLAKHLDIKSYKIPVLNQSILNKVQDNTKSNVSIPKTFVLAKHQDIKNFKSPMPNQPVINKVQDNTKSNTSVPKTFVLAKHLDINAFKTSVQNQCIINNVQDNTKPDTFSSKKYVLAKHQGINTFKIPVQTQSVINKVQDNNKSSTSEPKKIVFAKRQDISGFKLPVVSQSVINQVQDPSAYRIPAQKRFVYAKFDDNSTFKVPLQNKSLLKLVEDTTTSNAPRPGQNIFDRDDSIKIPVLNKSSSNNTTLKSAGTIPNKQVLLNKKIIPTSPMVASKNEVSYTIHKKTFVNPDKVGIPKSNTSNITIRPSVITSKLNTTPSIAIIPRGTIIKATAPISNSTSTVNSANVNCNNQFSNLTQELKIVPPTMTKSKLYIPHNGKNYMIKPLKKEDSNILSSKLNSLSSMVQPTVLKPASVEPLKNIIVSSSEVSNAFNPNSVTQFIKNMENLPDGEYRMSPSENNVPLCIENLFKPTAAPSVEHRPVTDRPNGPVDNSFVRLEEKSIPSVGDKHHVNSKETGPFKKPYPVLPQKSPSTEVSNKTIDFDNIGKIKKSIPISLFNKAGKYKTMDGAIIPRKTNDKKGKISIPKKCAPSKFIKLTPNPETLNQLKKQQLNSANSDSLDKPNIKFSLNEQGNPQVLIKVKNSNENSTITTGVPMVGKIQVLPEISNLPKIANAYSQIPEVFSDENKLSLPKKKLSLPKKTNKKLRKIRPKYNKKNLCPPTPTCEYEYCDTSILGIELIDNMYCSETCKKFNTKLMIAQEKTPVVRKKIDTEIQKKPVIDRKTILSTLREKINLRKKSKQSLRPEKISQIDYIEHEKKSKTIQAICERPLYKRIPIRKPIIKSIKGSQSDDDEILHLRPKIDHQKIKNYIASLQFIVAPKKLFVKHFPTKPNLFRVGQKLEGIDPGHESLFCVMTVMEVFGYRIKLHFDGYPNIYDFWVSADCPDIFYSKWCEQNSRIVQPPKNYKNFDWTDYLRLKHALPAPKWNFSSTKHLAVPHTHKFVIGNKLEALDKLTRTLPKQLICVATVGDILGDRILIHFDGWSIDYDYWVDIRSSNIHPVGWCKKNGRALARPSGYNDLRGKKPFTWSSYLEETNSKPVPEEAFFRTPLREFTVNMAIEIFDIAVPSLLRIAKVVDIKGNEIKIRYDGFSPMYEYWVEDDSPDIHPIGWSLKANHPLEIPADPTKRNLCGVTGCNGKGNINFTKSNHADAKSCPYVTDRWKNVISGFSLIVDRVKNIVKPPLRPEPHTITPEKLPNKVSNELPMKRPKGRPLKHPNEPPLKRPKESPLKRLNKLPIEPPDEPPMKRPNKLPLKHPNELSKKLPEEITKEVPEKTICKSKKQEILRKKIAIRKARKIMHEEKKKKYIQYLAAHETFGIKHNKSNDHFTKSSIPRMVSIMEDMELRVDDPWKYMANDDFIKSKGKRVKLSCRRNAILGIPDVNASDVKKWCVSQVGAFVDQVVINNSTYRSAEDQILVSDSFMDKEIDGEMLLTLTKEDLLKQLHINLGPAIKIYSAIKILNSRVPEIDFSEELDLP